MAYTLNPSNYTASSLPNAIGQNYHFGLTDGTVYYGYMFKNDGKDSQGIKESSNITDKAALIQYSSTALIDRDLAYYPRVSQGDYTGGGLQTIFVNNNQYMDGDLDVTIKGYLTLRPAWITKTATPNAANNFPFSQICAYGGDYYASFGENNGTVYKVGVQSASAMTTSTAPDGPATGLFSDGSRLYHGSGANLNYTVANFSGGWVAVTNLLNGVAARWFFVQQGTNGCFAYYNVIGAGGAAGNVDKLYKIDLTLGLPIVPANQPQVPTGTNRCHIVDVCASGTGIAILTQDAIGTSSDVWQHDGTNMTRIVRIEGYTGVGMCNCLGNLYVAAFDGGSANSNMLSGGGPVLIQLAGGQYRVVARPSMPGFTFVSSQVGQPTAGGEWVYWVVGLHTPMGVNSERRILAYNSITGAIEYLPFISVTDFSGTWNAVGSDAPVQRQLAPIGQGVAGVYWNANASTGYVQYPSEFFGSFGNGFTYRATGTVISSSIDFSTPGISKRFRRIEVRHAPLRTGESILLNAYVDQDPTQFTPGLTPVPSSATITNSTVGSTVTILTFGVSTVGRSLYYTLTLGSGSGNTTAPSVSSVAVEAGGTWTWDLMADCTSRRRTLSQQPDDQGVTGKDLYFLLRNAYENGTSLTLYLAGGLSYQVNIESLDGLAASYVNQPNGGPDQEWLAHVVLRQIA